LLATRAWRRPRFRPWPKPATVNRDHACLITRVTNGLLHQYSLCPPRTDRVRQYPLVCEHA
jgi:hypothetical protein